MLRIGCSLAYHDGSSVPSLFYLSSTPKVYESATGLSEHLKVLSSPHWWNGMALIRGMVILGIEPRMVNHGTKKGRGDNQLHQHSARTALLLSSRVYIGWDSDQISDPLR